MLLCDFCETKPATLVCQDCYQGAWCSRDCQMQDMDEHDEYDCFHPNEMEDEHVLEEVEHAVSDPQEARELLMAHIGEELLGTRADRRRRRRLRRRRSRMRRKRRRLRRSRRRDARDRRNVKREQRRLRKEDNRFDRELRKNNLPRNQDEVIDPEVDYDELAASKINRLFKSEY